MHPQSLASHGLSGMRTMHKMHGSGPNRPSSADHIRPCHFFSAASTKRFS